MCSIGRMWVSNGRGGIYRVGWVRVSFAFNHMLIDLDIDREFGSTYCA
jgi:hypothetical protein